MDRHHEVQFLIRPPVGCDFSRCDIKNTDPRPQPKRFRSAAIIPQQSDHDLRQPRQHPAHAEATDYNAALLARSLGTAIRPKRAKEGEAWDAGFGSFHEKVTLPDGLIDGSGHQLWSAAAFLNVCIRAGLVG